MHLYVPAGRPVPPSGACVARNTSPAPALNLDNAAEHMAERRLIVTAGLGSSKRPWSITAAKHRSETMARGRRQVANKSQCDAAPL